MQRMQRTLRCRPAARAAAACALLALAACTEPAYDPVPAAGEPVRITRVRSPLSVEDTYRRLYARIDDCLGRSTYHVQPRFDRSAGVGTVMVVSGVGLDKFSFIGNRFDVRFDARAAPDGTLVEITQTDRSLIPLVEQVEGWVARDTRGCGH